MGKLKVWANLWYDLVMITDMSASVAMKKTEELFSRDRQAVFKVFEGYSFKIFIVS